MKLKQNIRSIAFRNDNLFLLVYQDKKNTILELKTDGTFERLIDIPKKFWRFRVYDNHILTTDDSYMNEIYKYPIDGGKGKKLTDKARYWHKVTSTLPQHEYYIVGKKIFVFRADEWINLDENPDKRLADEKDVLFFTTSYKGLHQHSFLNDPSEWDLLCSITDRSKEYEIDGKQYWYDPDYRQIAYSPNLKQIALVNNDAYFVNLDGTLKQQSHPKKFWSTVSHKGKFYFYRWGTVIEMSADGKSVTLNMKGQPTRDQCLFTNGEYLFVLYKSGLYQYNGEVWKEIVVPSAPNPTAD